MTEYENKIFDVNAPSEAVIGEDVTVTFTVETENLPHVVYVCAVNDDSGECLKNERFTFGALHDNDDDLTFTMPDTPTLNLVLELWEEFPDKYEGCPGETL